MALEQKLEKRAREIEYWEVKRLGPFESCYALAKAEGYKVMNMTPKGLRLHIPSSRNWATITEEGRSGKNWMLVSYNYHPTDQEPLVK